MRSLRSWTVPRVAALATLLAASACAGGEDVYVAGWAVEADMSRARLWKNGAPVPLEGADQPSKAVGLAVAGGDVVACGGVSNGSVDQAVLWRDGALVPLSDGANQAFAQGIAAQGQRLVAVGYEVLDGMQVATVWRDGAVERLGGGSGASAALAVALGGEDVYVAGFEVTTTEVEPNHFLVANVARLWKNGVGTWLGDGREPSLAAAVAVLGADVYVAGFVGSGNVLVATLWKNGVPQPLADDLYGSLARGLALQGEDVLVVGVENDGRTDVARLWRNGAPADLTSMGPGGATAPASARAVTLGDEGVYAAGWHADEAVYWKGGEERKLPGGGVHAEALAIAVVGR